MEKSTNFNIVKLLNDQRSANNTFHGKLFYDLAILYMQKGHVYANLDDLTTAGECFGKAIDIWVFKVLLWKPRRHGGNQEKAKKRGGETSKRGAGKLKSDEMRLLIKVNI